MRKPKRRFGVLGRRARRVPRLALAGLALVGAVAGAAVGREQTQEPVVHVVDISGAIDLGLPAYLDRALQQAHDAGAAAVLLEVDTPGGRLDAVLQMQSSLVGADVRTIAFVNRMALSAGALITIASEEIYVAPGSTLGAATRGSRPRASAVDRNVLRTAEMVFSSASSPVSPTTRNETSSSHACWSRIRPSGSRPASLCSLIQRRRS
jgi:membrane-bound ClpP family serine protease